MSLLDDATGVARRCEQVLREEGARALPFLDAAADDAPEPRRTLARELAATIRREGAERAFVEFVREPGTPIDLEEGSFLLARVARPGLDVARYRARLDEMAANLEERVAQAPDPVSLGLLFQMALGGEENLRGNRQAYYEPENSFVDRVLDRRIGIPISLSAIYLFVARRLDCPLHGVGMPGHFLVQCGTEGNLFLDPFNHGRLMKRDDCMDFLRRAGFGADPTLLRIMPDRFILARMLANLVQNYRRLDDADNLARYARLFELVRGEPAPL